MNRSLLSFALLIHLTATASAHQRHHRHEERDIEPGIRLEFDITYLNAWGHTVADGRGLTFFHDALSEQWGITPPLMSMDPTVLPSQYWGSYPLYYGGQTMYYTIKIANTGHRKFKNLTVVAIQEYLSPTGQVNTRIGADAVRDWFIPKLGRHESKTLFGSINIPNVGESGLDQTHIQVFRSARHNDEEQQDENERFDARRHRHGEDSPALRPRLIYENIQAGIWCPPSEQPRRP
ncbi:MAG: hypothetical protein AAB036_11195 [Elusimicrobiota bacterium]